MTEPVILNKNPYHSDEWLSYKWDNVSDAIIDARFAKIPDAIIFEPDPNAPKTKEDYLKWMFEDDKPLMDTTVDQQISKDILDEDKASASALRDEPVQQITNDGNEHSNHPCKATFAINLGITDFTTDKAETVSLFNKLLELCKTNKYADYDKLKLPVFTPAIDTRGTNNPTKSTHPFICFDLDDGNIQLNELISKFKLWNYFIHSTASATNDNKRWRIYLPLSEELTVEVRDNYRDLLKSEGIIQFFIDKFELPLSPQRHIGKHDLAFAPKNNDIYFEYHYQDDVKDYNTKWLMDQLDCLIPNESYEHSTTDISNIDGDKLYEWAKHTILYVSYDGDNRQECWQHVGLTLSALFNKDPRGLELFKQWCHDTANWKIVYTPIKDNKGNIIGKKNPKKVNSYDERECERFYREWRPETFGLNIETMLKYVLDGKAKSLLQLWFNKINDEVDGNAYYINDEFIDQHSGKTVAWKRHTAKYWQWLCSDDDNKPIIANVMRFAVDRIPNKDNPLIGLLITKCVETIFEDKDHFNFPTEVLSSLMTDVDERQQFKWQLKSIFKVA